MSDPIREHWWQGIGILVYNAVVSAGLIFLAFLFDGWHRSYFLVLAGVMAGAALFMAYALRKYYRKWFKK